MNESDDLLIERFDKKKAVSMDPEKKVWCVKRVFGPSGRTNCLFFSQKLYDDRKKALDSRAWRRVEEYFEVVRMKEDGTLKVSKTMLRKLRNPLIYCNVSVQTTLLKEKEEMYSFVREELSNGREGFFKLESSEELTEEHAYYAYRERDTIEKLIVPEGPYRHGAPEGMVRCLRERNIGGLFPCTDDPLNDKVRTFGTINPLKQKPHPFFGKVDTYGH